MYEILVNARSSNVKYKMKATNIILPPEDW